jgi:nucleoside-diphosphate-sugar epimerase
VVFVGDVVKGHVSAALNGRTGEKYILGGENLTHKDVFQITAEVVGGVVPRIRMPVPLLRLAAKIFDVAGTILGKEPLLSSELISGAGLNNWYSSEKAQRELGYTITPFRDAVTKTYQWYVENHLL